MMDEKNRQTLNEQEAEAVNGGTAAAKKNTVDKLTNTNNRNNVIHKAPWENDPNVTVRKKV